MPVGMKRTAEKNPQKVQKNNQQQCVAAPVMNVADQLAEIDNILQADNRFISPVGDRLVGEFQHQARDKEYTHQHDRHPAKPPGKRKSKGALRDHPWAKVQ